MVVLEVIEIIGINDIEHFVQHFRLEKEFKEEFNCDIDKWDFECCDEGCIETLLEGLKENYIVYYDDVNEGFILFKVKIN